LCRERGLTLNTVMQGIWALQLASYCGHQDVVFGEVQDDRVHELEMTLPPAEERRLLTLCRERGLTLNTVMQGIWALQLASYCGHQDVVFG
ncbi:hypothetical protein, partial [Enterobacter hormaechei]|uniref:hypothetical protein n=1 Tax=Enterobacter hormaechei TaxID=158836 RepID=UPI003CC5859D